MCKAMEDMRNQATKEKVTSIARRMLKTGKYTYEDIADVLEISVDEVKALDESKPA